MEPLPSCKWVPAVNVLLDRLVSVGGVFGRAAASAVAVAIVVVAVLVHGGRCLHRLVAGHIPAGGVMRVLQVVLTPFVALCAVVLLLVVPVFVAIGRKLRLIG